MQICKKGAAALALLLLLSLNGCTALLDTGPVIEDDPITVSGVDPVEKAIRTWDESHVPYTIANLGQVDYDDLLTYADGQGLDMEDVLRRWETEGRLPEGYETQLPQPGASDMTWQEAANRADAVRRAVGFNKREDRDWELALYEPRSLDPQWDRPLFRCYCLGAEGGALELRLDSVTGSLVYLSDTSPDTSGSTAAIWPYYELWHDPDNPEDYALARDVINGCAPALEELQQQMSELGAVLGLPELTWQPIPVVDGADSVHPLPAAREDCSPDDCTYWLTVIGLQADAPDGGHFWVELDRFCGTLRTLSRHPASETFELPADVP